MKIFTICLLVAMASGTAAYADDVDGSWNGVVASPQGEVPVAFTFLADGATLTGTTTSIDGTEVTIDDGMIEGESITFNVTMDLGGMPFTLSYMGIVSTEEIQISGDAFGMPFEFVLTRADEE